MTDTSFDMSDLTSDNTPQSSAPAAQETAPAAQTPAQTETTPKEPAPAAQEAAPKAVSLRDQITAAVKGEAAPDGPTRDAQGRFAAAQREGGLTDPNAQSQAQVPTGAEGNPSPAPVPVGIKPEVFNALPAETQAELARTMEHVSQQQSRFAAYEQLEQVIGPRQQAWAQNGVQPAQALNQLFAVSDFATSDPVAFIQWFASQRGMDLETLALEALQTSPQQAQVRFDNLHMQQQLQTIEQHNQMQAHQNTVSEIYQFAEEKGSDGTPLRPYFSELGASLNPYVAQVRDQNPNAPRTQILQEAYERACWATPAIRAKMIEAQKAADEAQRVREQQERAAKARAAGSTLPATGVPAGGAPQGTQGQSMTLRESIRAAMTAQ